MSLFDSASVVITPSGYKASKLYAIKPTDGSGDLTVVRATTARRVNNAGLIESVANNIPRLDYTNSTCPSILVEPQRTNLLLRSEEFDNAIWEILGTITRTPNVITSPDGNLTADLILGGNLNSSVSQLYTGTTGLLYSFSFFIKNNNSTTSQLFIRQNLTAVDARLNWSGNELTSITNVTGTTTFENYGNGWYRIKSTYTSLETYQRGRIVPTRSTNQSIYIWGAQLEVGSNATSYIPTTSASVTRNADVISKTGISSLIGQTEGTLFVHFNSKELDVQQYFLGINTNSSNRIIIFKQSDNTIQAQIRKNGIVSVSFSTSTITENTDYKVAISYQENNVNFYVNGVLIGTDNSAEIPTCSNLTLDDGTGVRNFYRPLKSIQLYKTALTESECINLTTI